MNKKASEGIIVPSPVEIKRKRAQSEKRGMHVKEEELKAAFSFLDVSGTGKITLANIKNRMGAFYSNMPIKEYKFLMNNQSELTYDDLFDLVKDNVVTNFDPIVEAFKVYDPTNSGYIDTSILKGIFKRLGFGDLTEDDLKILVETADIDGDGKLGIEDFRNISNFAVDPETNEEVLDVEK